MKAYKKVTKKLKRFNLLQKNGWKSHRYEKKAIFDILGIVYEYSDLFCIHMFKRVPYFKNIKIQTKPPLKSKL